MASRRSTRVTQVSPWIPGGEGRFRDLFPLHPLVFLFFRGIVKAIRHYLITSLFLLSLYLWISADWAWWAAFIIFPATFLLLRLFSLTLLLWYRNPTIPLFARKPNQ